MRRAINARAETAAEKASFRPSTLITPLHGRMPVRILDGLEGVWLARTNRSLQRLETFHPLIDDLPPEASQQVPQAAVLQLKATEFLIAEQLHAAEALAPAPEPHVPATAALPAVQAQPPHQAAQRYGGSWISVSPESRITEVQTGQLSSQPSRSAFSNRPIDTAALTLALVSSATGIARYHGGVMPSLLPDP